MSASRDQSTIDIDEHALPYGIDKKELKPGAMKTISDDKLARFAIGHQKKTKFQRDREERKAKQRKNEADAQKVFEQFVASFEGNDYNRSFVSGGMQGGQTVSVFNQQSSNPSNTNISRITPKKPQKKRSEMDKMLEEMKRNEEERRPSKKKKREIDNILDEIRDRKPDLPKIEESGLNKGSFDNGDQETTNLCVRNLSPSITEEILEKEFKKYGEIHSIKIMWPRTEEERNRGRNCGFVSYFNREDAEDARIHLNEKEIFGQPMLVGWGKAIKIDPFVQKKRQLIISSSKSTTDPIHSPKSLNLSKKKDKIEIKIPEDMVQKERIDRLALYVAKDGLAFERLVQAKEENNDDYIFLFQSTHPLQYYYRWKVYSLVNGDDMNKWQTKPFSMSKDGPIWIPPMMITKRSPSSSSSSSRHKRLNSDKSNTRSRRDRDRSRERHSDRRRKHSVEKDSMRDHERDRKRTHRRQRSRSRSYSSSSSSSSSSSRSRSRSSSEERPRRSRRRKSESFFDRNEEHCMTGQQLQRARDRQRGRENSRLSSDEVQDLEDLLENVTTERELIKNIMGFALDYSEAASDVVDIIFESCLEMDSPPHVKIAKLFVISDILHNSTAPVKNASMYRTRFQDCLPTVLQDLNQSYNKIEGRMSANLMQEKVLSVLRAWESWSLFPPLFLVGLHFTFAQKPKKETEQEEQKQLEQSDEIQDVDSLRRKCRMAGLVSTGNGTELMMRLKNLQEFTSQHDKQKNQKDDKEKLMTDSSIEDGVVDVSMLLGVPVPKRDDESENNEIEQDDMDGEPLDDEDIDGVPLDEEDIDGEPLDEEDIDGEPLDDEDIDGVPMDD